MSEPLRIPSDWQLPEAFLQRIGTGVGRQRLLEFERQVLILAHMVPHKDEVSRRGVLFWRNAAGEWKSSNGDSGSVALELHLNRYAETLDAFEIIESKAQTSSEYLPLLEGLAPVARSIRNLFEVLEETRQSIPDDRAFIDHRDRAYELSRQAELLYTDARNSMEVAVVRQAEEQSKASFHMTASAHRLNVLAALFFPIGTLGAVLGTTLTDNWSWSQNSIPFFLFIVAGITSGVFLAFLISQSPKK